MPDKTPTIEQQEAAADRYWQMKIERGRAVAAEQETKDAPTNEARVRQDRSEGHRTRRGYSRR